MSNKEGYTFLYWQKGDQPYDFNEPVYEDITLVAKWEINKYLVKFVNYDGSLLEEKEIEYNTIPTYNGLTPTKNANETYTYHFIGWDKEIKPVTKEVTYKAKYESKYIDYKVTFIYDNGQTSDIKTYHYGDSVVIPTTQTILVTPEYTYTFIGWDKTISSVTGDVTYTAQYSKEKNKYTVTFINHDGTILQEEQVEYGAMPIYNGATPTKESDETYTYSFDTWDTEIVSVVGEATYKAIFKETYIDYEVTFDFANGDAIDTKKYHYGDTVVEPDNPVKANTKEYTYTFDGWDKSIEPVTGNVIYTAQYSATKNKYKITFQNYDGTVLQQEEVEFGTIPTYNGTTPLKASDEAYTYSFDKWDTAIAEVEGDATYTASFKETYIDYTVTFDFANGDASDVKTYHYGDTVVAPADPVKSNTKEYTYEFTGWDKSIELVTGNVTYTAQYSATKNKYKITFQNYDGTVLQEEQIEYGVKPTYNGTTPTKASDEAYTYTFDTWDTEIARVEGETTYTATFKETYIDYSVTFVYDNGTKMDTKNYHYGDTVTIPTIEDVIVTPEYTYTFTNWDKTIEKVTGNVTYTAQYDKVKTKYTIKFVNYNGDLLQEEEVEYGVIPTYNGATPVKVSDNTYTYSFDKWNTEIARVEGEATYTATFKETYIDYSVTFVYDNGTKMDTKNYHYGDTVTIPIIEDVIVTPEYTYTFTNWDKTIEKVTGNTTYTAQYSKIKNTYTVKFVNYNGDVLQQETIEYGVMPVYKVSNPIKPNTKEYTYTFTEWDKSIEPVIGNVTYTAQYSATKNKYKITFQNYDGMVLQQEEVEYGVKPTYNGATPVKASDETYTYVFNTWDTPVVNVETEATYTATFSETYIDYNVKFVYDNGTKTDIKTYHYGQTVVIPNISTKYVEPEYTYTFIGWDKTISSVTGDVTYTAQYSKEKNKYTVTFINHDGTQTQQENVEYGTVLSNLNEPVAPDGYVFNGYKEKQLTDIIISNTTLTVKYSEKIDIEHELNNSINQIKQMNLDTFDIQPIANDVVDVSIEKKLIGLDEATDTWTKISAAFDAKQMIEDIVSIMEKLSSNEKYKSVVLKYDNQTLNLSELVYSDLEFGDFVPKTHKYASVLLLAGIRAAGPTESSTKFARFISKIAGYSGGQGSDMLNVTADKLVDGTNKMPIDVEITLKDEYADLDGEKVIHYDMIFSKGY